MTKPEVFLMHDGHLSGDVRQTKRLGNLVEHLLADISLLESLWKPWQANGSLLMNSGHEVTWQQSIWNTPTIQDFPTQKRMSHIFRSATVILQVRRQNTCHIALMTINPEACKKWMPCTTAPLAERPWEQWLKVHKSFPLSLSLHQKPA